jgi:hypothetical protein
LPASAATASGRKARPALTACDRPVDPARIRDDKFAYGLEVVLDGLALRLAK